MRGRVVKAGPDKGDTLAGIVDMGVLAWDSSEGGGVSVNYQGGGGHVCDGLGAHGLGHLVIGVLTGALGLASLCPQCILPARHPSGSSSVSHVGAKIHSFRS